MVKLQQDIDIKKIFGLLKRKDIAVIIAIILLFFIFIANAVRNNKRIISEIQKNSAQEEDELKLLKEIKALDKSIKKASAAFKEFNITNLINRITAVSDQCGLNVDSIDPSPSRRDKKFIISPVDIVLRGDYHGFGKFINAIENFDEFIEIKEFKINIMKREVGIEGSVELNIKVNLECFTWS